MPWALESLAGSLCEKFPEFAVMEIVYTHSMGQGEGASQICRSVRDGKKSWKTEGVEDAQNLIFFLL